eukprot:SAG31_NODE_12051_length_974_cov_0.640000_1_plen_183_part_00
MVPMSPAGMAASSVARVLSLASLLAAAAAGAAATAGEFRRQRVSLDGPSWNFALHAPVVGVDASTTLGPVVKRGRIVVPGSWEAQGYGNSTASMRSQVLTGDSAKGSRGAVGVYTTNVTLDECTAESRNRGSCAVVAHLPPNTIRRSPSQDDLDPAVWQCHKNALHLRHRCNSRCTSPNPEC